MEEKRDCNNNPFQNPGPQIRSLTKIGEGCWTNIGLKKVGLEIHESSCIRTCAPFSIRQCIPSMRTSLLQRMLFHEYDQPFLSSASEKVDSLNYFPFKMWPAKDVRSLISRHACFTTKTLLNNCNSLKPSPTISLGRQTLLLRSHVIFLLPSWEPHQNLRIKYLSSSQSFLGRGKMLIT